MREYLVLVSAENEVGSASLLVMPGRQILGSSSGCDLIVQHPGIAKRHAELIFDESAWLVVRDLGTPGGTFVDDYRVENCCIVRRGQKVRFGTVSFWAVGTWFPGTDGHVAIDPSCYKVAEATMDWLNAHLSSSQLHACGEILLGLPENQIASLLGTKREAVHEYLTKLSEHRALLTREGDANGLASDLDEEEMAKTMQGLIGHPPSQHAPKAGRLQNARHTAAGRSAKSSSRTEASVG